MKHFKHMVAASALALGMTGPAFAADQVKMMFDWLPGGLSGSWYAARSNGCFDDQDLEFTFDRGAGGVDTVAKVAAGVSDIGMADLGTIMLGVEQNGADVKAILPLYSESPFSIMTLKRTGINSLNDLEGTKMASGPGDSTILMLPQAMELVGADFSKIEQEKADFSALLGLLMQGQIESHTTFYTVGKILEQVVSGAGMEPNLIHVGKDLGIYGLVIFANGEFLRENPEVAARTADAITCAYSAARDNPGAIADALLTEFPEKKRETEMASINGGIELVFETDAFKAHGFGWDDAQVQQTFEMTMKSQGVTASGTAADAIHTFAD